MDYLVGVFALLGVVGIALYLLIFLWVLHPVKFQKGRQWLLDVCRHCVGSSCEKEPARIRRYMYNRRKYRIPPSRLSVRQLEAIPEEEEEWFKMLRCVGSISLVVCPTPPPPPVLFQSPLRTPWIFCDISRHPKHIAPLNFLFSSYSTLKLVSFFAVQASKVTTLCKILHVTLQAPLSGIDSNKISFSGCHLGIVDVSED